MKIVLAYSGGVDSAYLKKRLESEGHEVLPFRAELPDLTIEQVKMNRRDRCYWCKRAMFEKLKEYARQNGADLVVDGTNADDLKEYRPGLRARDELGVRSPLAEAGLGKADVRRLAAQAGLDVADKPSSPCMATRFPYDTMLTQEKLETVALAESLVRRFIPPTADLRVRCEGDYARIETGEDNFPRLEAAWSEVESALKRLGFASAGIDRRGFRSGCYDS